MSPVAAPDPFVVYAPYNTGVTSGMAAGTTYSSALGSPGLSSGAGVAAPGVQVGGNANISVAVMVALALGVLLATHLLGFRWGFDVTVGRR